MPDGAQFWLDDVNLFRARVRQGGANGRSVHYRGGGPARQVRLRIHHFDGAKGWRFIVLDGNEAGYGIISDAQMRWFEGALKRAAAQNEHVIVFSHYALTRDAAPQHRMNAQSANPLLSLIEGSGVVVAWFAGHDRVGGYGLRNGIHHVTVQGIVEAPDNNAYALIELHSDRINIVGFGKAASRELYFDLDKRR